jgi:putative oligomerization/nucleic acid binding protein
MKMTTSTLIWTFIWCIFMGITAGSIGIGAIFPPANLIAKPFVCPAGKMDVVTQVYRPYPGKTITTLTWYCVDDLTGAKKELGIFPMSLYAGTIYGLLLFAVVFAGMLVLARGGALGPGAVGSTSGIDLAGINATVEQAAQFRKQAEGFREQAGQFRSKARASSEAVARMKELKELRASNMISEAEYEKKRAEILKDL